MTLLYDDYAAYAQRYKRDYGEATTLVVYEVGNFLEWYNCDQNLGCDVNAVCDLLNVRSTRRSKTVERVSRTNPMLGGVPKHAFGKYLPILLENDYTVVVVSQLTSPPQPITRGVTEIISRGMCVDEDVAGRATGRLPPGRDNNFVMCVYVDDAPSRQGRNAPDLAHAGCALLDLLTGESLALEVCSRPDDPHFARDEVRRLIREHAPLEIVLHGGSRAWRALLADGWKDDALLTSLAREMAVCPRQLRSRIDSPPDERARFEMIKFQEATLRKVFPGTGLLSAAEALDLERHPLATSAFVALLQFAFEHNEAAVQNIRRPVVHAIDGDSEAKHAMELTYNAAEQLDILCPSATGGAAGASLLGLLNSAVTAMGRRLFRRRLLHPSADAAVIDARLADVEACLPHADAVRARLSEVRDLDRAFRRVALGRAEPADFDVLDESLAAVAEAGGVAGGAAGGVAGVVSELADRLRRAYTSRLDLGRARGVPCVAEVHTNIFAEGIFPHLDDLQATSGQGRALLQCFVDRLNSAQGSGFFRLVHEEATGRLAVLGTHLRCRAMLGAMQNESLVITTAAVGRGAVRTEVVDGSALAVVGGGGTAAGAPSRVEHPLLCGLAARVAEAEAEIQGIVRREFAGFLSELWRTEGETMRRLAEGVATLDVSCACARNARTWRHVRPVVDCGEGGEGGAPQSRVRLRAVRHPVLEVLHTHTPHVANDVDLSPDRHLGMLLYGMNAAGKSSLMKAVALAAVMAQAGMFVACSEMHLRTPFRRVLTRIQSRDNLQRGQSTFMVEMSELRDILQRSDARSLVIGDEVCSGTEAVSALAIVGASVKQLIRQRTPFIFATHLHELPRLLLGQPQLRVCHLRVHYDPSSGELRFDRNLCDGQGPTAYGLEVCKALDMRAEFLDEAHAIRRTLTGVPAHLGASKASHFNARVLMGTCVLCKARPSQETHHIAHQAAADADGYIAHFHKNAAFNLVPLCGACHDAVHDGRVSVQGYVQTSSGVELVV